MTDVKAVPTFDVLRSVIASDPYHQQFQPLLDHIDTLTAERDAAVQDAARQLDLRYAANRELVALQRETDALRSKLARSKAKTRRYFGMLKWQLQSLRRDHARLDWLSDSAQIEAIGIDDVDEAGGCVGMDMYEHASIVARERGNEDDLTDSDLRKGFRRMIDAAMAVQP
jgi:hypothetical protein